MLQEEKDGERTSAMTRTDDTEEAEVMKITGRTGVTKVRERTEMR